MARKKIQSLDQLAALRRVRKAVPPPSRAKEDDKKYRRVAARREARKEVERDVREE
jgi:hypothetical protein